MDKIDTHLSLMIQSAWAEKFVRCQHHNLVCNNIVIHWVYCYLLGILLNVKRTKTIQNKENVLQIPIYYVNSDVFCAVSMLDTHLARTRHITEGPLFWKFDKADRWRPLLYKDFLESYLKSCVQSIGLNSIRMILYSPILSSPRISVIFFNS